MRGSFILSTIGFMPLTLRRTWSDPRETSDFIVCDDGGRSLARVYRDKTTTTERWYWSVNGFNVPQDGNMRGDASSLDEAKELMRPVIHRLLEAGTQLMPNPPEWKRGTLL